MDHNLPPTTMPEATTLPVESIADPATEPTTIPSGDTHPVQAPPQPPFPPMPHNHPNSPTFPFSKVLMAFILIAVVGFSVFYAGIYMNLNKEVTKATEVGQQPTRSATKEPLPTTSSIQGWQIFTSSSSAITFKYPPIYSLEEQLPTTPVQFTKDLNAVGLISFFPLQKGEINGANPTIFVVRSDDKRFADWKSYMETLFAQQLANPSTQVVSTIIGGEQAEEIKLANKNTQSNSGILFTVHNTLLYIIEYSLDTHVTREYLDSLIGSIQFHAAVSSIPSNQICTQEAKQCPDGSYVSRTGPNCTFATCPVH